MCLEVATDSVKTIRNALFSHWWECNCDFIHADAECLRLLTSMLLIHKIFQMGCTSLRAHLSIERTTPKGWELVPVVQVSRHSEPHITRRGGRRFRGFTHEERKDVLRTHLGIPPPSGCPRPHRPWRVAPKLQPNLPLIHHFPSLHLSSEETSRRYVRKCRASKTAS